MTREHHLIPANSSSYFQKQFTPAHTRYHFDNEADDGPLLRDWGNICSVAALYLGAFICWAWHRPVERNVVVGNTANEKLRVLVVEAIDVVRFGIGAVVR